MTRWAVPEDAPELADVHVTTWQVAYRGILDESFLLGLDRGAREAWWRRFIAEGARVHVVGEERVVGFCHATGSADEGWGEVFSIYVHPEWWGSGLGHRLLAAGEDSLRRLGFDRALLWVLERNVRARSFYEGHGWVRGRPIRVEDIGGVQVNEIRYEKDLTGPDRPLPGRSETSP